MLSSAWMRYCLILWTLDVHLCSRSPQGERGLKYGAAGVLEVELGSLPARGAWIEIYQAQDGTNRTVSLPARGAWIEIKSPTRKMDAISSLPARGAWIEMLGSSPARSSVLVAPRKGSVD